MLSCLPECFTESTSYHWNISFLISLQTDLLFVFMPGFWLNYLLHLQSNLLGQLPVPFVPCPELSFASLISVDGGLSVVNSLYEESRRTKQKYKASDIMLSVVLNQTEINFSSRSGV